jgi:hypothetical protein
MTGPERPDAAANVRDPASNITQTVPVRREQLRLEPEPVTGANEEGGTTCAMTDDRNQLRTPTGRHDGHQWRRSATAPVVAASTLAEEVP